MSEILSEFILWKPLKAASAVMFGLVLVLLPFSQFWSVIMLFALICLWSRVPCLISMFTKDFDVVDFFVVMLALNVSGAFGGVFGLVVMLFSRIFGPREWFLYTLKDAVSIMIGGFLAPVFYSAFGSALATLYAFTIVRWTLYLIFTALIEPEAMGLELGLCTIGTVKSYIYNTLVMKTFEGYLLRVFEGGVHFSLGLLLFAGAVVGGFYALSRASKPLEVWWMSLKEKSRKKHWQCTVEHDCVHQD